MLRLWKVDYDSEQKPGSREGNSVFQISRSIAQGRSFGNEVALEIKAVYSVLSICRSFLERLVATVSPAHVSSLVVSQIVPYAHIEYRILLPAFHLLSCGQVRVR